MALHRTLKQIPTLPIPTLTLTRAISTVQRISTRPRDPTLENYMRHYKNLLKVISIQDLILSHPHKTPPSISLPFLTSLSQKLHLNRGAISFIKQYPHIFETFHNPANNTACVKLTEKAARISEEEGRAVGETVAVGVDRLVRVLCMSVSGAVPLRAVFKVWREMGLPDDFEASVIGENGHLFRLSEGNEVTTHVVSLVEGVRREEMTAAVEGWRVREGCCGEERFSFNLGFPPGMRLRKEYKKRVKEWQRVAYVGPYEEVRGGRRRGRREMEKRAVAIVHEFLSLTVEKMVEVDKISQFRKWFGIEFNIRDLFLDHPGLFYLSTKGKKDMVFLREAYQRGRLVDPNPVYEARMKLLELVMMQRRGFKSQSSRDVSEEGDMQDEGEGLDEGDVQDEG